MNEEQLLAFEKQILTTQIQLEETMKKIASAMNKPTVILLDRVRAPVTTWWCAGTARPVLSDIALVVVRVSLYAS
jgi:mRNA deadenylase 3'-5' endonuclease subunit Ccr4